MHDEEFVAMECAPIGDALEKRLSEGTNEIKGKVTDCLRCHCAPSRIPGWSARDKGPHCLIQNHLEQGALPHLKISPNGDGLIPYYGRSVRKMRLSMDQKRVITERLSAKYRACRKHRQRSQILDEVVEITDYERHYAAWLLRNMGKQRLVKFATGEVVRLVIGRHNKRRPTARPRTYDSSAARVVILLWESFDQMCGKRLVAILPQLLRAYAKREGRSKNTAVLEKLLHISAATIDRILAPERAKRRLKGIAHTKPTTVLKNSIPIVISSELPVEHPGMFQMDLVGHDGGNPNGQFAFSQNAVELYSGWVEPRILLNKAHSWVKKAAASIRDSSPVPLRGFHTDTDSAFINEPLQQWCAQEAICFSRGRPYHSNDTCYVEQKNYNIVRQALGYARFETQQEVALIARLYETLRLLVNFFYPSVKLLNKERHKGRIRKSYDKPRTPATRLPRLPGGITPSQGEAAPSIAGAGSLPA